MHKNDLKEDYALGINGGHQGFKDAYKAIQTILDDPKSLSNVKDAQALLDSAFTSLNTARSNIAAQEKILENTSADNENKAKKADEYKQEIIGIDMANLTREYQQARLSLSINYMLASKPLSFLQFMQGAA